MTENKIIITKDLMDKVIEELTEYRAIGTVEGYKRAIETSKENYLLYAEYKAKVQEFEAIGTIEEFKALKEKTEPKKPDIEKFWGYDDLMCPGCKTYFVGEPKYCCKCGQAIDWQ